MDVYTLTPQFFPNVNIDRFFSLIWTERYYDAGDFQLVVPVTPALVSQLAPGTFVALRGQQEIMVVDTLSIDSNSMTVTGSSLVKFLNQRLAWFTDPGYDGTSDSTDGSSLTTTSGNKYADFNTDIETAGEFISGVIDNMCIDPVPFDSPWLSINLDWANEVFPHLSLGNVDDNGDAKDLSFPIGPLFDGLVQVAQAQNIGFKLYLESTDYDTGDHSLKFATYRGKDRTTDQDTFDLVRFSPNLDNFTGVKEIITNVDFKNVVYVTFENKVTVHYPDWVDPDSPPLDWRRRVIRVDAPDIHLNPGDDRIANFRARVAQNTFNHQRGSRSIDGQVLAIEHTYSFPDDYYLGDLVELEGQTGIVKARVIEYIRSQNQYGQTEYPTFDVLHPLDTSFIGDPIFHPPWNDPPVATGPFDKPPLPLSDCLLFTDGHSNIQTCNSDGSGEKTIFASSWPDNDFSHIRYYWSVVTASYDGTVIIAVNGGSNNDLYAIGLDGNTLTHLTFLEDVVFAPQGNMSFNPQDNSKFAVQGADESSVIIVDLSDSSYTQIPISDFTDRAPSFGSVYWSPDGTKIVYPITATVDGVAAYGIGIMNADGTDQSDLIPASDNTIRWSAWGWYSDSTNLIVSKISLTYPGPVEIYKSDGSTSTLIYTDFTNDHFLQGPAIIKPDDTRLAFMDYRSPGLIDQLTLPGGDESLLIEPNNGGSFWNFFWVPPN